MAMRENIRHYVDTSMGSGTASYVLIGDGVSTLTETMNATEETKHYINMEKDSNAVKSYQRSFEVDREDCVDDAMKTWLEKMVDTLPVGTSAKTTFVRFRLSDTSASGVYEAIQVPCTVSVTSEGGDGGDYVHQIVSFKQCGDDVSGKFTLATASFAAGE